MLGSQRVSITDMILSSLQDYSAEGKTQQHQAPALPSCCCWEHLPCCITASSNLPHWRWACIFYYETVTKQSSSPSLLQQVRISKILLFTISSTFSVCRWVGGMSRLKRAGQVHHCAHKSKLVVNAFLSPAVIWPLLSKFHRHGLGWVRNWWW